MRAINEIIVHCTATPEGRPVSVAEIRKWHKARGWADIGYHFVVHLDGRIEPGRPVSQVGAHVANRNAQTIGVAYVGGLDKAGKPKDTRTASQKAALEQLLRRLLSQYPAIKLIAGHRDYANKACPCFDARAEYARLLTPAPVPAPVAKAAKAAEPKPVPVVETVAATAADGADELPWWKRSPVLRQIVATGSALGVTAGTFAGLDYRAIIALSLIGGAVAITAMIIQARKPASTEGMA